MTTRSVLILAAVFSVAFGVLVWWLSRRRGKPERLTIFIGIAGVYVGGWGVMTREHWLYVPCVTLILASYGFDFAVRRRSERRDRVTGHNESPARRE
jgi:drug/metabolite transporter (DMT)-like permease